MAKGIGRRDLIRGGLAAGATLGFAARAFAEPLAESFDKAFALQPVPPAVPAAVPAPVPVVTARAAGFDGPITFHAVGGQLADKAEGRTRVYAEFPEAGSKQLELSGKAVSKILANTA